MDKEKVRFVIYGMYNFKLKPEDFGKFIFEVKDKICYRVSGIKELNLKLWEMKFALPQDGEKPAPDEAVERDIIVDVSEIAAKVKDFHKAEEEVVNLAVKRAKEELLKEIPKKEEKRKWWRIW